MNNSKNIKLQLVIIFFLLLVYFSQKSYSKTTIDQFNTEKTQYENGNYPQAIQNLKALKLSVTLNPKV